jgi:lambda family phage portal protein
MSEVVAERRRLELQERLHAEAETARLAYEAEREESGKRKAVKRSYDAARLNRLNADWTVVNTSSNFELRRSLRVLRARSRNLARNSDYVKKFLSMVRDNVSGPAGMKLQARAVDARGEPDEALNKRVEAAWREWCHAENASLNGKLSFRDIERKADTTLARDGELLVRAVAADNKFGFALKFYAVDWLDETYNERLISGNRVIMSVEIDDTDRPVAYWLTPPPADYQFLDTNVSGRYRTRVPAEEIIHLYLPDDENSDDDSQTRGVPWAHTAMARLKLLGGYEEAEVVAARIGASKMGFFQQTTPDEESYGGEDKEKEASGGELMDSPQPGTFGIIPEDYEFKEWNPQHPNTNYGAFIKGVLRGIAAGLGVTYFSLAEDLEGVNYSSARIGLLAERDVWRGLQGFKKEHFNRRIYLLWLRAAMLAGAIDIRVSDYKRLLEPIWHARGWTWIDPKDDVQATALAIASNLDSLTGSLGEQGRELEDVIAERKREITLLKEAGLPTALPVPVGGGNTPSAQADGGGETPLK